MNLFYCIGIILLIVCLNVQLSTQSQDEKRLHEYLFGNGTYKPEIRPLVKSSDIVHVSVKLVVKRLFYVDEVNHKVTIFAALVKKWSDEFLKWNASDFGGIEYTYVDYSQIWTPQIELVSKYSNENNEAGNFKETYDNFPVKINSNGTVEFVPTIHLTSRCLFTYLNFPMDIQLCNLLFQTPYRKEQLEYHLEPVLAVDSGNLGSMWDIIDLQFLDFTDVSGNPMNNVLLTLKRKMKSYLFTIPSYIIYTMTLVMFLLPQTSSQRIVIGASCLVMITMLTYMMSNSLPHNDITSWPLLGKLYLFNAIMLTFSIMFSAFIINVSQADHSKSVPDWLKKLTVNVLAKIFCIKSVVYAVFSSFDQKYTIYYEDEVARIQSNLNPEQANSHVNTNNDKLKGLFVKIYEHVQQIRHAYQRYSYKQIINNEWLLVANILDRILFLIYICIIITSTYAILKTK